MGAVAGLKVSGTGDDTKVEELWKQLEVVAGYSEPVLIDNRLYLVDDRCKMWIFDADTGEPIVERKAFVGSRQRSALLHADGKIYVLTENGRWAIVKPTEDGFEVLSKGRVRDTGFAGSPIVADGRLYFPRHDDLVLRRQRGCADKMRCRLPIRWAKKRRLAKTPTVAQVQIVPAEALV